jgi:hypothetical protein
MQRAAPHCMQIAVAQKCAFESHCDAAIWGRETYDCGRRPLGCQLRSSSSSVKDMVAVGAAMRGRDGSKMESRMKKRSSKDERKEKNSLASAAGYRLLLVVNRAWGNWW